jgi:hemoglobin
MTPYETIGGEAVLRALVRDFYRIMDELPEAYGIRKLHPSNLAGRDLFAQCFGHPRLRARHLPFAIADHMRNQG